MTLLEDRHGIVWRNGVAYVYRRPYPDERALSCGYVVVEFGTGNIVRSPHRDLVREVERLTRRTP